MVLNDSNHMMITYIRMMSTIHSDVWSTECDWQVGHFIVGTNLKVVHFTAHQVMTSMSDLKLTKLALKIYSKCRPVKNKPLYDVWLNFVDISSLKVSINEALSNLLLSDWDRSTKKRVSVIRMTSIIQLTTIAMNHAYKHYDTHLS